eukprot:RCo040843
MRVRLLFAAIAVIVLTVLPGVLFAVLFHACAFAVLDWAGDVVGLSRETTLVAQQSIRLAMNASSSSERGSVASEQATAEVLVQLKTLVLQMHLRAMEQMGTAVSRRLDAVEGATHAMHEAWEFGLLKSCDLDSPQLTLVAFMANFLEQVLTFHPNIQNIYYDEPVPTAEGKFMECGWGNYSGCELYAMGDDQKYVCWEDGPRVSRDVYVSKDVNASSFYYDEDDLAVLIATGALWESYVSLWVSPVLMYTRCLTTTRNNSLMGVLCADISMEFLSSALHRSLVSPQSSAFVVDLTRKHSVVAHTFPELPLFIDDTAAETLVPFTLEMFPSPLVQACVGDLTSTSGALENVTTQFSDFSWNGTLYLYSTLVFHRRGLQWLACQLTPKADFQGIVSSAAANLTAVLSLGSSSVSKMVGLMGTLSSLSQSADLTMELTTEATSGVRSSEVVFVGTAVCVLAGCLALTAGVVLRTVFLVRQLSLQMNMVSKMQLTGVSLAETASLELDSLQRAFRGMVRCLEPYTHFLPSGMLRRDGSRLSGRGSQSSPQPSALSPVPLEVPQSSSQRCTPPNPLRSNRESFSRASIDFNLFPVMFAPGPDRRFSTASTAQAPSYQSGTVVCVGQDGADLMAECLTPGMFTRRVTELVTLLKSCMGQSSYLTFFGDQLLAVFMRPEHYLPALHAVCE